VKLKKCLQSVNIARHELFRFRGLACSTRLSGEVNSALKHRAR
jgi:hypothetical protein